MFLDREEATNFNLAKHKGMELLLTLRRSLKSYSESMLPKLLRHNGIEVNLELSFESI